jgi:hypothetical protein
MSTITTFSALKTYDSVPLSVGATLPRRDTVDRRIVANVKNGTGRIINSQSEVGGYPAYASGTPPADSDHDGMPDTWESTNGFNAQSAADGPQDRDGDGYTNVEEYLNGTNPGSGGVGMRAPASPGRSGVSVVSDTYTFTGARIVRSAKGCPIAGLLIRRGGGGSVTLSGKR